ncbi:MAG: cation:proton antiporter [Rhizobiales bacterium]|nr:cation:proton antiporter [Hyphomicrobiales bacterium]
MTYSFLEIAIWFSLAMLTVSFFLTIYRVISGPTLPDRIVALDMLVAIAIGYIAVIGVKTGYYLYVDIAIALSLVGFLATVAFARFILTQGITREDAEEMKKEDTLHLDNNGGEQ